MKRIFSVVAFVCLLACSSFASTIPVTGTISLPDGSKLTGTVRLTLSYSAARDTTNNNVVVAQSVLFRVQQGTLQSSAQVVPNDVLQPANTWYTAEYFTSSGAKVAQAHFYISGQSFDLGSAVPTPVTTSNLSFGNFTGLTNLTSKKINNVRMCDQFTGSTAGAKIAACIADLPSTGGIADARGLEGAQTISSNPFSGVTKPVKLLLGAATFSVSTTIETTNTIGTSIIGLGPQNTQLVWTGTDNGGPMLTVSASQMDVFEDFSITSISSAHTLATGIWIYSRSSGGTYVSKKHVFRNIWITSDGANLTDGIRIGGTGSDGTTDANNDFHEFYGIFISNFTQYGVRLEGTQSYGNLFQGCVISSQGQPALAGITNGPSGGGFGGGITFVAGGVAGASTMTAFEFNDTRGGGYYIAHTDVETVGRLLTTGGPAGSTGKVVMDSVEVRTSSLNADGKVIIYKVSGPLVITGSRIGDQSVGLKIDYNPGGPTDGYSFVFTGNTVTSTNTTTATLFPTKAPNVMMANTINVDTTPALNFGADETINVYAPGTSGLTITDGSSTGMTVPHILLTGPTPSLGMTVAGFSGTGTMQILRDASNGSKFQFDNTNNKTVLTNMFDDTGTAFEFVSRGANASPVHGFRMAGTGAVQLGSPTGGYVGANSINAAGVIEFGGATGTASGSNVQLGTTTGTSAGTAGTTVTATTKGAGTGPTTAQTIVKWIKINIAGTDYWVPLMQMVWILPRRWRKPKRRHYPVSS